MQSVREDSVMRFMFDFFEDDMVCKALSKITKNNYLQYDILKTNLLKAIWE